MLRSASQQCRGHLTMHYYQLRSSVVGGQESRIKRDGKLLLKEIFVGSTPKPGPGGERRQRKLVT